MEGKIEERVGGRKEDGKGERPDAGEVLPLYFWIFHFYTCSPSISKKRKKKKENNSWWLQATQLLAPGLSMHQHKAVCEALSTPMCFTGRHPPSPASTTATNPGKSAPGGLHFLAQGLELWRTSGHKSEAPLALHQEELLLLFVPRHHMTCSGHWLLGQPIGALRLQEVGAEECLWGYSLAHSHACLPANPLRHCHHPSLPSTL